MTYGAPGFAAGTHAHFQNFRQAPFHRAYAIARNVNGSCSAVHVGNQPSAAAAEQAALAQCRAYAGRKLATDPSSCRVYAVDDTILSTGQKAAGRRRSTSVSPAGGPCGLRDDLHLVR